MQLTLSRLRSVVDSLADAVSEDQADRSSLSSSCTLGTACISPESSIVKFKNFENAVFGIHKGTVEALPAKERYAALPLPKSGSPGFESSEIVEMLTITERLTKKGKSKP